MRFFLLMVLAVVGGSAFAQHQCKDSRGRATFQDKPCEMGSTEMGAAPAYGGQQKPPVIGSPEHLRGVAADLERQLTKKAAERAAAPRPVLVDRQKHKVESNSNPMDFDVCVAAASRMALQVGFAGRSTPIIVNTPDMLVRRICTDDGSVIVTCSRADRKMTTTSSPYGSRAEGCF